MNFSFIFKMIFVSFFLFLILYAISFVSVQNDLNDSNSIMSKNVVKESINIGDLRANNNITYNNDKLLNRAIENYIKLNNVNVDKVRFDIAINENTVTIKVYTYKGMFELNSDSVKIFSYEVIKED